MKKYLLILLVSTFSYSQWGSLASNQLVTEANLAGGGFTLIGSNPNTNKIVTKSEALAMYNLDAAAMSSYASNQCPPKSAFVSGSVTGYALAFGNYSNSYMSSDYGSSWAASNAGNGPGWNGCAISTNGLYLFACDGDSSVKRSVNSGSTWTAPISSGAWSDIACSNSGQFVTVIGYSQETKTSSDYGATWTTRTTGYGYDSLTLSTSGRYQIMTVWNITPKISNDYGVTWTTLSGLTTPRDFCIEGDAIYIWAAQSGSNYIAVSSNGGIGWTNVTSAGQRNWQGIDCDETGTYITATDHGGYIYVSNNSGTTWTAVTAAGVANWINIVVSATGQYQIASKAGSNYFWTSSDFGVTWIEHPELVQARYKAIAI